MSGQLQRVYDPVTASQVNANFDVVEELLRVVVTNDHQPVPVIWGSIVGTLSDQTDLQEELDSKVWLQDVTPGFDQNGNATINGRMVAGWFQGSGEDLTDLNIDDGTF